MTDDVRNYQDYVEQMEGFIIHLAPPSKECTLLEMEVVSKRDMDISGRCMGKGQVVMWAQRTPLGLVRTLYGNREKHR